MSFYKENGYSEKLSSEGKFFVLNKKYPEIEFKLKHARSAPEYMTYITSKRMEETNRLKPLEAEVEIRKLIAEHLLVGWKNLEWDLDGDGEKKIEYSKDNAFRVLKTADQLVAQIVNVCSDPRNFVDAVKMPRPPRGLKEKEESVEGEDPKKKSS